jgi:hypothetical protein
MRKVCAVALRGRVLAATDVSWAQGVKLRCIGSLKNLKGEDSYG